MPSKQQKNLESIELEQMYASQSFSDNCNIINNDESDLIKSKEYKS